MPSSRRTAVLALVGVAAALGVAAAVLGASRGEGESRKGACAPSASTPVPQPTAGQLRAAGLHELPIASPSDRVDLVAPPFTISTRVTNPLFPIAELRSAILNGQVDGKPFRVETTLLPGTRILEWSDGQCVETLVSQYLAYSDGRIKEVALDLYAQAEDGSVWYLGEDVFNYEDGVIAELDGTWHAGVDGPAAMIMPGDPQVGDAFRPENIAGLVFEEVTIKAVGQTVEGPRGPVRGAIVTRELHDDGSTEEKIFAPGYGEFSTGAGEDVEAIALAVPTDAQTGPLPRALADLANGADEVFDAARPGQWTRASAAAAAMSAAWTSYRADAPVRLRAPTTRALDALVRAVEQRDRGEARRTAIAVGQAAIDLELQYRPIAAVDLARFELWLRQVAVDAGADEPAAVAGDLATLEWIRDRFTHALDRVDATRIDTRLRELRKHLEDEDLEAAAETAAQLRAIVAEAELSG